MLIWVVTALFAGNALLWLGLAAACRRADRSLPRLGPASARAGGDAPPVTIVFPARNEAGRMLTECVESLLAQRYASFDVIAVDDVSTDATPAILGAFAARDPRLSVRQSSEPPEGWLGKPWAVQHGVSAATGEWILATDADVRLHPDALAIALAAARERGLAFISLLPSAYREDFWVNVVMPVGMWLTVALYPPAGDAPGADRQCLAYGGFMLYRRSALEAVGGYASVRDRIAEDVALARAFKQHGFGAASVFAPELVYTPWCRSLGEIWRGLGKMAVMPSPWVAVVLCGLGLLASAVPAAGGLAALGAVAAGHESWFPVALSGLAAWLAQASAVWPAYRSYGVAAPFSLGAPFGMAFILLMAVHSTWRNAHGAGVSWRGRNVFGGPTTVGEDAPGTTPCPDSRTQSPRP